MKKALLPMVLMVALAVTSCVDNDVYDSNKNTDEPALDLSFSFALKSSKNLSLSAFNGEGNFGKSVLFNVYFEFPTHSSASHISNHHNDCLGHLYGLLCELRG